MTRSPSSGADRVHIDLQSLVQRAPFAGLLERLATTAESADERRELLEEMRQALLEEYPDLQSGDPTMTETQLNRMIELATLSRQEQLRKETWGQWFGRQAMALPGRVINTITAPFRYWYVTIPVLLLLLTILAKYWGWVGDNTPVYDPAPGMAEVAKAGVPMAPKVPLPSGQGISKPLLPRGHWQGPSFFEN